MKIALEAHGIPEVQRFMKTVEAAAQNMGHQVVWWKGFFETFPPTIKEDAEYPPPRADLAFVWNGIAPALEKYIGYWQMTGIPVMRVELGWYPQRDSYQVDHNGVNGYASWATVPVPFARRTRAVVKNKEEILVLLQDEVDTQLLYFSPWISLDSMLKLLIDFAPQKLVIRKHPYKAPSQKIIDIVEGSKKCVWDTHTKYSDALLKYDLVAMINSSAAIEAMGRGKVVLCFGRSVYRVRGAVVCMENDGTQLTALLKNLGEIPVWREGQQAVMQNILKRQWKLEDVPQKLDYLLRAIPV